MCSSWSMAGLEFEDRQRQKKGGALASLLDVRLLGQRGFGLLRDLSECRSVVNGQIREHLAIDVDRRFFQAVHEHAVAHSQLAHGSVDTGNPQRPEFTLFLAPVAVLILPRLHHRFFGDAIDVAATAAIALGFVEDLFVPRFGGNSTLYSRHGSSPLCVRQHGFDRIRVGAVDAGRAAKLTFALGGLLGKDVALERLRALDAAASAHAEALLGAALGLHFRHDTTFAFYLLPTAVLSGGEAFWLSPLPASGLFG